MVCQMVISDHRPVRQNFNWVWPGWASLRKIFEHRPAGAVGSSRVAVRNRWSRQREQLSPSLLHSCEQTHLRWVCFLSSAFLGPVYT